jgi:hypothetical protein
MTIDVPVAVKGSFRGLVVLVVGTVLLPAVARLLPAVAPVWLSVIVVMGFAIAAVHQGVAVRPVAQALYAAVGAYLLVVPLAWMAPAGRDVGRLLVMGSAAVITGVATGAVIALVRRWRRGPARVEEV